MARFHSYSFGNQLAIARQKPTATRVAGFHKWLELRRYVKKGEKGIAILAPMVIKRKNEDADGTKENGSRENGPRLIGFKKVYVFDLAQTDGEPLAEFEMHVKGCVGDWMEKLFAQIRAGGMQVEYDATIAPAVGMQCGNTIKLLPEQYPAEEFTTLIHEYAHALLHRGERRAQTTKTVRETEAEATSYIVSTALGIDCGTASSDYIQMYDGNAETLLESLQHVQGAASEILAALEA